MTYRPLPPYLTIKQSEIDGLGLFATEDIEGDKYLGITHFLFPEFDQWIRTPLGGFYNHSENPNAESFEWGGAWVDLKTRSLTTLRPISAGEEITVKYTLPEYEGDDWKSRNSARMNGGE